MCGQNHVYSVYNSSSIKNITSNKKILPGAYVPGIYLVLCLVFSYFFEIGRSGNLTFYALRTNSSFYTVYRRGIPGKAYEQSHNTIHIPTHYPHPHPTPTSPTLITHTTGTTTAAASSSQQSLCRVNSCPSSSRPPPLFITSSSSSSSDFDRQRGER